MTLPCLLLSCGKLITSLSCQGHANDFMFSKTKKKIFKKKMYGRNLKCESLGPDIMGNVLT